MPVKKIRSTEVEKGMFVSSLDRPWSETPFLFQGFLVKENEEINQLRELSRHVYIMVPDDEITIDRVPHATLSSSWRKSQSNHATTPIAPKKTARDQAYENSVNHTEISNVIADTFSLLQSGKQLHLDKIEQSTAIMIESIEKNPSSYIWLTKIKHFNSYLYKDALSSSVLASAMGAQLGLEREQTLHLAIGAMLMDCGKTAIPKEIVNKSSSLDHDEWELMKTHVSLGTSMLNNTENISPFILETVQTHHERLDGSGYPSSLHQSQIPLFGQIAGIIDYYVSVTTPRPYANAISPSDAIKGLYQLRHRYFDETLIENFIQVIGTYPTGSLVELSSGEVGIVTSQNPGSRLKPNLVLILDKNKKPYGNFPVINLLHYSHDQDTPPVQIQHTLADGEYGINIEELKLQAYDG